MIYLAGWGAIYFTLLIRLLSGYRGKFFGVLTIFFLAGIAVFRGSTGTDTATYELILSELSLETVWDGMEPGFSLVSMLLTDMFGSAAAGVRAVSALFFILIGFYYFKSDENEEVVLFSYFAPAYFYIYSMNGLRIGVASVALMVAVQYLRRNYLLTSRLVVLAAILFHYSILFSIGYFLVNYFKKIRLRYVLLLGLSGLLFFYFVNEYIFLKLTTYSDFELPGPLSGLSKIIVICMLVFGVLFSDLSSALRLRVFLSTMLFSGFAIVITQFSYAGLRLLDLIAFVFPLVILILHSEAKSYFNWKIKLSFMLAGVFAAIAVYRGFLLEAGQGKSPFMPYELISDFFDFY